jgi:ssDNA-binding Zn-finger/Zn-ribbon topoisomerase 1
MPADVPRCPKCNHQMELGYVADVVRYSALQSSWTPGKPERRLFLGGIKWHRRERIPIVSYRCANCGFLESYALPLLTMKPYRIP